MSNDTTKQFAIAVKPVGFWRNFTDGSVAKYDSRLVAERVISNWQIDAEIIPANQAPDLAREVERLRSSLNLALGLLEGTVIDSEAGTALDRIRVAAGEKGKA